MSCKYILTEAKYTVINILFFKTGSHIQNKKPLYIFLWKNNINNIILKNM